MTEEYSREIQAKLEKELIRCSLHRPGRYSHHEPGKILELEARGVSSGEPIRLKVEVDKFVGGGFAGQVYRVILREIMSGQMDELSPGSFYAMKILIPPSGSSSLFRNALYWLGFQGSFQLQTNPSAARAGALWQKFLRRGAKVRWGDERAVVDIHVTFVDKALGSMGEISEWVEGRTWRLEVDDRLDLLKKWRRGKKVDESRLGSPEYRAKRRFMREFVELVHEMGGHEFARQYEWSTWKSQPNCLKRKDTEQDPSTGLVAVDFRAGLALLPFLPMSPGDFKLIFQGLARGSLVQFDRGNLKRLERYIQKHPDEFSDMLPLLEELKKEDKIYRNSLPDVTHNHVRLFFSRNLWKTLFQSTRKGWAVRNIVSDPCLKSLEKSPFKTFLFYWLGAVPILGRFIRKIWARPDYRRHYGAILTSFSYLRRAFRAKVLEMLMDWHRSERISDEKTLRMIDKISRCLLHLPFSIFPASLHRLCTDATRFKEKLSYYLVRPVRLYFDGKLREQWLYDMVSEGKKEYLITDEDAEEIYSQIKEPYIQKYLKSLAVHVCTLPVTQVVSVIVALGFVLLNPEMPRAQAWAIGIGIIAAFQIVPISPGSLVRGLYVLYLVIRERNFRDYNIAVFLGFFKYVGYLAFPIQMAHRYPTLARFMAGHWATGAVHMVPVFGERGALLEHTIYSLFYNWPLTVRRRTGKRAEMRERIPGRYWHVALWGIVGSALWGGLIFNFLGRHESIPELKDFWWLTIILPFFCGSLVTLGAGGARLEKRIVLAGICGILQAIGASGAIVYFSPDAWATPDLWSFTIWRIFLFTLISVSGALLTELFLPEPPASRSDRSTPDQTYEKYTEVTEGS